MKDRIKKSIILISVAMAVNVVLAAIKMYVGLSSNSLCIMLDGTNSFFDVITCLVTLVVFIFLLVPRNEKAPYGYGRGEYLAGFIVAVVSVVVGGLFLIRSLNRMAMPEPVWFGLQNCILISVAIPVKLSIGLAYYFANKKIKSAAIKAIMLDSFLDTGMTATSLISFAVSARVDYAVDAIFGIVMSVVIIVVAIKMVAENVRAIVLGDGAKEEKAAIENACEQRGAHLEKTVLHDYGYGMKVGNAYYTGNAIDAREMSEEVFDKTGAEVEFINVESVAESVRNCAAQSQNSEISENSETDDTQTADNSQKE